MCGASRLFVVICLLAMGPDTYADPVRPGTRRMAERLQKLIDAAGTENPNARLQRAAATRAKILQGVGPRERLELQLQLAVDLLQGGRPEEALKEFASLRAMLGNGISQKNGIELHKQAALCYLRIGEQRNCLLNHNADSCLAPISPRGVHKDPAGSAGAIRELTEWLKFEPESLAARWMLNIAHMTLGTWPDQVPAQWRVEPKAFRSDIPFPRFYDVAAATGVDVDDLAGGSVAEDFDGDGFLDIMCSSMNWSSQLRFFRNLGNGTFVERTREAGLIGEVGGLNLNHCDYNNDGLADVLVLRGGWQGEMGCFPNSLLRNLGDGTFEDVTEAAGLLSFHPTQTATWFDYNGDGWIDLFIGNETTTGKPHPCELYRNNCDGTFTECSAQAGVNIEGFVKAVTSGDYNNDGRPDLYLSRLGQPNLLFRNDGPEGVRSNAWKFTEVGGAAGVTEPINSFPCWFFDYNNDGWLDLFVSGYFLNDVGSVAADYLELPTGGARTRLYRNNRDGTFADVSKEARLDRVVISMGSNYGDLDNDGFLDLYLGTGDPDYSTLVPNRMFRNAAGKLFQDITSAGGFGHLQKGHGISFADFDNDGDQDIYQVMGGAYPGDNYRNVLYENPGATNHWLTLKLEGVKSNRAAFGARIKVIVDGGSGERTIYKTVATGGSFGDSPFRQEIGLGDARALKRVEVYWPVTGQTQQVQGLTLDGFFAVREGESKAAAYAPKRFQFAREAAHHTHH